MSFDVHVTEMSTKVFGTLMYINRIQDLLSKETRLKAVVSVALSHISDGVAVWSTANITQQKRVKKLQNFAAKEEGHLRAMHNIFQNNGHSAP